MRQNTPPASDSTEKPSRKNLMLSRLYREIGLAAVAFELDIMPHDLEPEFREAVRRGARYLRFDLLDMAS